MSSELHMTSKYVNDDWDGMSRHVGVILDLHASRTVFSFTMYR